MNDLALILCLKFNCLRFQGAEEEVDGFKNMVKTQQCKLLLSPNFVVVPEI